LHFINISDKSNGNKSEDSSSLSNLENDHLENIKKWVNSPILSDHVIKTKQNTEFYIHLGFLLENIDNSEDLMTFLKEINNRYDEIQLTEIF